MTRMTMLLFAVTLVFVAAGCPGVVVNRNGATANLAMPTELRQRAAYPGVVSGYNFQDLVGCILKVRPDGSASILDAFHPDSSFGVTVRMLEKPGAWYHSRIQKGADVKLGCSYLAFAANLADREMVDYSLADDAVATAGAPTHELLRALGEWAARNPLTDSRTRRLWVREVVRSAQTLTRYDSVQAHAGVQYGELVGVNGTVYRRAEQASCSWVYGLDVIDVDSVATRTQTRDVVLPPADEVWQQYRYTGPLSGTLELP